VSHQSADSLNSQPVASTHSPDLYDRAYRQADETVDDDPESYDEQPIPALSISRDVPDLPNSAFADQSNKVHRRGAFQTSSQSPSELLVHQSVDQRDASQSIDNSPDEQYEHPIVKRGRGRPRKYINPPSHGADRIIQRDPVFADPPITSKRLSTTAGRLSTDIHKRRWQAKNPKPKSPKPQVVKQPYNKTPAEQAQWVVNSKVNYGLNVRQTQQKFREMYEKDIREGQIRDIWKRAAENGGSAAPKDPKGKPVHYTEADREWYANLRESQPRLKAKDISKKYIEHLEENHSHVDPAYRLSSSTQSQWNKELLITRKRLTHEPVQRNDPMQIAARQLYAHKALTWVDDSVIYIDEAGFDRDLNVSYGYSMVGEPAVGSVVEGGLRLNVISAISTYGLVHFHCSVQSTTAESYAHFIEDMIRQNREMFSNQHFHLVHDGVPFHSAPVVLDVLTSQTLQHSFEVIPPYSPALNGIENFWHSVRSLAQSRYSELINPNHQLSLQRLIEESMRNVQAEKFLGYHAGVKKALLPCIEGRPLAANSASIEYSVNDRPLAFRAPPVMLSNSNPSNLSNPNSSNPSMLSHIQPSIIQPIHDNEEQKSFEPSILTHSVSLVPHAHPSTSSSPLARAHSLSATMHTVMNNHNQSNSHVHVKPSS
jgi:transposase